MDTGSLFFKAGLVVGGCTTNHGGHIGIRKLQPIGLMGRNRLVRKTTPSSSLRKTMGFVVELVWRSPENLEWLGSAEMDEMGGVSS